MPLSTSKLNRSPKGGHLTRRIDKMITIKAQTIFGEIVRKFDNQKEAIEWIEVNLANKVSFEVFM